MQSFRTPDGASRLARRRIARGWRKRDRSAHSQGLDLCAGSPTISFTTSECSGPPALTKVIGRSSCSANWSIATHPPAAAPKAKDAFERTNTPSCPRQHLVVYFVLKQRSRLRATARSAKHLRRERVSYGSLCHRSGSPLTLSKFPGLPA